MSGGIDDEVEWKITLLVLSMFNDSLLASSHRFTNKSSILTVLTGLLKFPYHSKCWCHRQRDKIAIFLRH